MYKVYDFSKEFFVKRLNMSLNKRSMNVIIYYIGILNTKKGFEYGKDFLKIEGLE